MVYFPFCFRGTPPPISTRISDKESPVKTSVEVNGEDLVVILPQKLMDALGLKPGDDVDITAEHRLQESDVR